MRSGRGQTCALSPPNCTARPRAPSRPSRNASGWIGAGRTVGFRHDAHTRFLRRADPKYHWVSAPLENGWRRDQWLVADGPAQAGGSRRVYVIHIWPPRFRCHVVAVEPGTGLPEPDHANAGNRQSTLPDPHEPAGVPSRRRNLGRMMRSEGDAEEVPNARISISWETNPRNRIPVRGPRSTGRILSRAACSGSVPSIPARFPNAPFWFGEHVGLPRGPPSEVVSNRDGLASGRRITVRLAPSGRSRRAIKGLPQAVNSVLPRRIAGIGRIREWVRNRRRNRTTMRLDWK